MKAILKFDLSDYESDDRMNHWHAINGHKAFLVLSEIDNYLRNTIKYDEKLSDDVIAFAETLREKIRYEMDDKNIRHNEYSL